MSWSRSMYYRDERRGFHVSIREEQELHGHSQLSRFSLHWVLFKVNISTTGLPEKALPKLCEYVVKNCILLPAVGKQNATFSPNFTNPGKSLLVQPCTCWRSVLPHWSTGLAFRLPPEIASDRRQFPAATETRDLWTLGHFSLSKHICITISLVGLGLLLTG